jgi:hypothetical protein
VQFVLAAALGFFLSAGIPIAYIALTQSAYGRLIVAWFRAMQRERNSHPYTLRDAGLYLFWLVSLGPAAVLTAITAWIKLRKQITRFPSVALAVTIPAIAQLALLGIYQDISFSPRYLLPALPGAIAIPAALMAEKSLLRTRPRVILSIASLLVPLLITAPLHGFRSCRPRLLLKVAIIVGLGLIASTENKT